MFSSIHTQIKHSKRITTRANNKLDKYNNKLQTKLCEYGLSLFLSKYIILELPGVVKDLALSLLWHMFDPWPEELQPAVIEAPKNLKI